MYVVYTFSDQKEWNLGKPDNLFGYDIAEIVYELKQTLKKNVLKWFVRYWHST